MTDLEPLIWKHPFFSDLQEVHLRLITGCAFNARFQSGELILRAGEQATAFYLVREGLVGLELSIQGKDPITIQTVDPGGVFGWSWIIPPYETYFDARAHAMTRAIGFDGTCLRHKLEEDKAFGYDLMKKFSQVLRDRMRMSQLQLVNLYSSTEACLADS